MISLILKYLSPAFCGDDSPYAASEELVSVAEEIPRLLLDFLFVYDSGLSVRFRRGIMLASGR